MSAATRLRLAIPGLLLAPLATFAACTDPAEPGPPAVETGTYHGYVQRGWVLPHDRTESIALGQDLDGDGYVDNQTGSLIGSLIGLGLELDTAADDAFQSGAIVALHRLRADSLVTDASIEWRTFAGVPAPAPRFDGTDAFTAAAETGRVTGMIRHGRAELTWGETRIALPFFPAQAALEVPLVDVSLLLDVDAGGCSGRLGGVIPAAEVDEAILPQLAAEAIIHMTRHPEHEFTRLATQVFDDDHDGRVTVAEILADPITRAFFKPDIDRDGDGERDGVSFGAGFDCVPASFTPPAP